jgi:pyridoxamine 5'-phosphate oxidase
MVDPNVGTEALRGALSGACAFANLELPTPLPAEPFVLLQAWLAEAWQRRTQPNPNAATLATVDPDGRPSIRVVLIRDLDAGLGVLKFYTNYQSRKGRAITHEPRVALCMHWDHLDRQVRVEGIAVPSPEWESDRYFASRPVMSRVAAWASRQSAPIDSRDSLLRQFDAAALRFGVPSNVPRDGKGDLPAEAAALVSVPRPPHWGGFRVVASAVELWLGHSARLHDRARWERTLTPASLEEPGGSSWQGYVGGLWSVTRLQP